MVEQEIYNLLVGVRFSHPAPNFLRIVLNYNIIPGGTSFNNHEENTMHGTAAVKNEIKVRSVCVNMSPGTTVTLIQSQYRFDPPPARCPQCFGKVVTDPGVMVKPGCYIERIE